MPNDALYLDEPKLEDALKTPYFFNGRLLTREDLSQEQLAQSTRRSQVGRALGSGVAYGLEVEESDVASPPGQVVLNVAPGLAITPEGDTLNVSELLSLRFSLRPGSAQPESSTAADFRDCGTVVASSMITTSGTYLLAIRCVTGKEGLAAVSGLGNEAAPCNTKYRTAGVGFRAIGLGTVAKPAEPLFRSRLAAECFGFSDTSLLKALYDPFGTPAPLEAPVRPSSGARAAEGYGKVDALRGVNDLLGCEVPLAVLHLNDDGSLSFLDTWPVRRSLVRPALTRRWWPFGGLDERRRAEGEAAMLCFQDHLRAIKASPALKANRAQDFFAFLPGGGFLPVDESHFDAKTFLGPQASVVTDGDFGRIRTLVEASWLCEPFDPAIPPPLVYYVFPEAAGKWVFFLRCSPESTSQPGPPQLPGTSPPSGPAPAQLGSVLVVAPGAWVGKRKKLELMLDSEALAPIDREEAIKLVNEDRKRSGGKRLQAERGPLENLGIKQKGKEQKPDARDLNRFENAKFFFLAEVPAGRHLLYVGDDKVPLEESDPLTITVEARRLKLVPLS
jgi:hypothetical protein